MSSENIKDMKIIEQKLNLHMNVNFSNLFNSKIKTWLMILNFIFFGVFCQICYLTYKVHALQMLNEEVQKLKILKGEIYALQTQMDDLMKFKNENKIINRFRSQLRRPYHYYYNSINLSKPSTHKLFDLTQVRNKRDSDTTSYFDEAIPFVPDRQKNVIEKDANTSLVTTSPAKLENSPILKKRDLMSSITRTALVFETPNRIMAKDEISVSNADLWKSRPKRLRRQNTRDKKQKRNKKKKCKNKAPLVATFIGTSPVIKNAVNIGPWTKKDESQYNLNKFHLVESNKSIEISLNGLYMISVQIFYFGETTNHSYWVILQPEGTSTTQKLIKCASASSNTSSDASCHTGIVTHLRRGDRLYIQQQEKNR